MKMDKKTESSYENFLYKLVYQVIKLDFVGKKPELLIGNSRRNKTFLGGLLSFLIYVLILIGFLYFGQEIVFKQIPSEVLSSVIDDGSKPIIIDNSDFNFFFGLVDQMGNVVDLNSDFFDISVNLVKMQKNYSKIGDENSYDLPIVTKNPVGYSNCDQIGNSIENEKRKTFEIKNKTYKNNDFSHKRNLKISNDLNDDKKVIIEGLLRNLNKSNYKCLSEIVKIKGNFETKELNYLEINIDSCLDIFGYISSKTQIELELVSKNLLEGLKNYKIDFKNYDSINKLFIRSNLDISLLSKEDFQFIITKKLCPLKNLTAYTQVMDKKSFYNRNINSINGSKFIFKYIDTFFDVRSFSKLANFIIENYQTKVNNNILKSTDFFLKKIDYYSDIGYIIEDFEITSYSKLNKIDEMIEFEESKIYTRPVLTLNIKANNIREIYYRKYYKIQNLIAELGGLLKSFFLMALILNYFNNSAKYYEKMIDELFDVDDLFRYYQYYNSTNKIIFKKYRDSILLRNTKNIDNYKKTIGDKHVHSSNVYMRTRINHSKDNLDLSQGNLEILNKHAKLNKFPDYAKQKTSTKENSNYKQDKLNSENNKIILEKEEENNSSINKMNNDKLELNIIQNQDFHNLKSENCNKQDNIRPETVKSNIEIQQYFFSKNNIDEVLSNENSFSDSIHSERVTKLRKNEKIKENFYKLKKKRFSLHMFEVMKFICCSKNEGTLRKKQVLSGGKSMIHQKLDVIHILKKNLEFDRFKNLMLRDYQLILLNSLSKFMLDPERINLVDFQNCNYDKIIDSYEEALNSETIIDFNLIKLVDTKFQIDKFKDL